MSGPSLFGKPRGLRRGAALTFVFGAVLATGAVTGALGGVSETSLRLSTDAIADGSTDDLSSALGDGQIEPEAAQELVSRSGDRWAAYYTEREFEGFQQALDGQYVGVGLWVRRASDGQVEVCRVQSGSPAQEGGVKVGDRLQSVDGRSMERRSVTEIVARLRGDGGDGEDRGDGEGGEDGAADDGAAEASGARPGTAVVLGLERGGRTWDVTLYRRVLATEDVSVGHPRPGVTRIRVGSFTRGVGDQVRGALRAPGVRKGAGEGGGVVLDLRGNPGGLVLEAVKVGSAFLDGGLVATYDDHGEPRALYAQSGGDATTPLVVLVDGGTMSAAEMLAGALQDRGRAVVVGSKTFGKGSVQQPSTLSDGSVVELTVGHYETPAGRSVDGAGVTPDLKVDPAAGPGAAERQALTVLGGLGTRP